MGRQTIKITEKISIVHEYDEIVDTPTAQAHAILINKIAKAIDGMTLPKELMGKRSYHKKEKLTDGIRKPYLRFSEEQIKIIKEMHGKKMSAEDTAKKLGIKDVARIKQKINNMGLKNINSNGNSNNS